MNIMIVDDSKAMRMIIKRTLRQAGFGHHNVTEAPNGLDALTAIRESPPEVVLCDWNMPKMSGYELLQALKKEAPGIKFGFVTSEATAAMREQAEQAGALFLIAKPFTSVNFEEALQGIL